MFDPSLGPRYLAQSTGPDISFLEGQGMPGGAGQGTRRIPMHPEGRSRRLKLCTTIWQIALRYCWILENIFMEYYARVF